MIPEIEAIATRLADPTIPYHSPDADHDLRVLLAALREAEAELAAALEVEEGLRQLIERENAEREELEAREARLREALDMLLELEHPARGYVGIVNEQLTYHVCKCAQHEAARAALAPTEPEAEREEFLQADESCPDCGHAARHHTQGGMCDGAGSECHCIRAWPISREQEVK